MSEIILCACKKGHKISEKTISEWKEKLDAAQLSYTFVEDLCGSIAKNEVQLSDLVKGKEPVFIGCQPKAMKNLVAKISSNDVPNTFQFYNLAESSPEILDDKEIQKGAPKTIKYEHGWKPWYPVLDYDLCTSCQKCMNFCLFGVYTIDDEGIVVVENPANCKDLCPACARTCPSNAIVFPKHHESPIDGGKGELPIFDGGNFLNQIQQNQDVYKLLANRRKASGITLMKDQLTLADKEREACKNKENE